jgi:chemotaxis protein MotB
VPVPRRAEAHEEHENHEAWVIPYADMLTLLMVMFLALYAMGNLDLAKFQRLAEAFSSELGGGEAVVDPNISDSVLTGGDSLLEGGSATQIAMNTWPVSNIVSTLTDREGREDALEALAREEAADAARDAETQALTELGEQVQARAQELGLGSDVVTQVTERGLAITVLTDSVLFGRGSAELAPRSDEVLRSIQDLFTGLDNTIEIIGHTDSSPISTGQYRDNYDLSSARANSVRRWYVDRGVGGERFRVSGAGEGQPVGDNATVEGRAANRRVEIVILADGTTVLPDGAAAGGDVTPAPSSPVIDPPISGGVDGSIPISPDTPLAERS